MTDGEIWVLGNAGLWPAFGPKKGTPAEASVPRQA